MINMSERFLVIQKSEPRATSEDNNDMGRPGVKTSRILSDETK